MWQLSMGYVADILLGDPYWLPHPVRFIGKLISFLEKLLIGEKVESNINAQNTDDYIRTSSQNIIDNSKKSQKINKANYSSKHKKILGVILLILVTGISYFIPFIILKIANDISYKLAIIIEAIMIYQILATKCLAVETRKVALALNARDLPEARQAISYLVSRDTHIMKEDDIVKATVETISENTIDGIVSPIFFILIGGAPLGWAFKAVNTLDSMVGYKNERYMDFGWASAKFDDVINYIPARITAGFILIISVLLGLDTQNALKIFLRDKRNHDSPNSPIAESVTAGALRIQLGGKASYFGVVSDKPTMGDDLEEPEASHIYDAILIMYGVSFISIVCCFIVKVGF